MRSRPSGLRLVLGLIVACVAGTNLQGDEKPQEPNKKSGAVVGVLTAKGEAWVEVKADGEQKARRYVANWVGGAPNDGGGPDKETVKTITALKVGSRVRLEWKFDERPRIVKVDVLKTAADKEDPKNADKKGTVTGTLTAKGKDWIEVKADGEEKARRYALHWGGTKELRDAIRETTLGSRVRIDWLFAERPRVLKLEVIKKADQGR